MVSPLLGVSFGSPAKGDRPHIMLVQYTHQRAHGCGGRARSYPVICCTSAIASDDEAGLIHVCAARTLLPRIGAYK